jgi:glycosyltransferase involved in cell wall biosynthesis
VLKAQQLLEGRQPNGAQQLPETQPMPESPLLKAQPLPEGQKRRTFKTIIAGDGDLKDWAEKKAEEYGLRNIEFTGFIKDEVKHRTLLEADALFFPSYTEGLPCSVLEAMLYGLPVITRNVGAIPEWIRDPENGIISDSFSPEFYADAISALAGSGERLLKISVLNHQTAMQNFTTEIIKERILSIYKIVLGE